MVCPQKRDSYHHQRVAGTHIKYTQKQIDKYQRQKYINELEKIGKNLFKMYRSEEIDAEKFIQKFDELYKKLSNYENIYLDIAYYKELKSYIDTLHKEYTNTSASIDDQYLHNQREMQMSTLNRLQKLKNSTTYKKVKHKNSHNNEYFE